MLKRNHNARYQPGNHAAIPVELEFAAMEDLGPLTRRAICDAPLGMLAVPIVDQIIARNDQIEEENRKRATQGAPQIPYLDPKEPRLDAFMAQHVTKHNYELLLKERAPIDALAGVQPLRRVSALQRRGRRR
jgi:hypothetical protein